MTLAANLVFGKGISTKAMVNSETMIEANLARAAYIGFCHHTRFNSVITGNTMPEWEGLSREVVEIWTTAAQEMLTYMANRCI